MMRKQELLTAIVANSQAEGIGDRSLREIATAVGTSHRMLIHHFGSRAGLLAAVVREVEADQRHFLTGIVPETDEPMVAMWQRLRDPALWPAERLFFECYSRAARGEAPFDALLPGLVDDWLDQVVSLDPDAATDATAARARARLGLAVFRGLLLDLVGTRDPDGVDAAFEAFRALVARSVSAPAATA
jgi:AcrR family transcriptional regulator